MSMSAVVSNGPLHIFSCLMISDHKAAAFMSRLSPCSQDRYENSIEIIVQNHHNPMIAKSSEQRNL